MVIKNLGLLLVLSFTIVACTPQAQQQVTDTLTDNSNESMAEEQTSMPAPVPGFEAVDEMMVSKDGDSMEKDVVVEDTMEITYSGQVLAGDQSLLLDFNKADYDKALAANKTIMLYFYASWCPICRAEFPKMQSAFNKLSDNNIVGFRVNFNDSQTDDNEKALAKQFGVAYQHTKVILQNGQRVLKAPDSWEESRYLEEINKLK